MDRAALHTHFSTLEDSRLAELYDLAYTIASTTHDPDSDEFYLAAAVEALINRHFREKTEGIVTLESAPGDALHEAVVKENEGIIQVAGLLCRQMLDRGSDSYEIGLRMDGKDLVVRVNVAD